jgi:hypothetical protein
MILIIGLEYAYRYFLSYKIKNINWDYIINILIIFRYDFI